VEEVVGAEVDEEVAMEVVQKETVRTENTATTQAEAGERKNGVTEALEAEGPPSTMRSLQREK